MAECAAPRNGQEMDRKKRPGRTIPSAKEFGLPRRASGPQLKAAPADMPSYSGRSEFCIFEVSLTRRKSACMRYYFCGNFCMFETLLNWQGLQV